MRVPICRWNGIRFCRHINQQFLRYIHHSSFPVRRSHLAGDHPTIVIKWSGTSTWHSHHLSWDNGFISNTWQQDLSFVRKVTNFRNQKSVFGAQINILNTITNFRTTRCFFVTSQVVRAHIDCKWKDLFFASSLLLAQMRRVKFSQIQDPFPEFNLYSMKWTIFCICGQLLLNQPVNKILVGNLLRQSRVLPKAKAFTLNIFSNRFSIKYYLTLEESVRDLKYFTSLIQIRKVR